MSGNFSRKQTGHRVEWLDGMRCLAICLVILFHYFARWTQPVYKSNLYPYFDALSAFPLARYGWCGVELFFMISGFVIAMTLTKCRSIGEFAARRYARLAPAMLICALLTYLVVSVAAAAPFSAQPRDFLPSLTFVNPDLLNWFFPAARFDSIDGAYWSLYVEVSFYVIAGGIYFLVSKRFFAQSLAMASVFAIALSTRHLGRFDPIVESLLIPKHIPWFLIGVGFYNSWVAPESKSPLLIVFIGVTELLIEAYRAWVPEDAIIALLLPLLFWCVLRFQILQRACSNRVLVMLGLSSYSFYLLHQVVGITFINALPVFFWKHQIAGILAALMIAAGIALLTNLSYRYAESPANRRLLTIFLKHRDPVRA